MSYNGWSNRATWNASLWLNNEEALYRDVQRMLRHIDKEDDDAVEELAGKLELYCRDIWPNGKTPDDDPLIDVDWEEIAKSELAE